MENKHTVLGIVTARGGSKGILHKNLYPIAGMPLMYYCITNAQNSGIFDRIILSTDDPKIADVGKNFGVEVPFMRPAHLAEDKTPTFDVIEHALGAIKEQYDYVGIIQPTAPVIQGFHWQEAYEVLLEKEADSVISVLEVPMKFHPSKAIMETEEGTYKVPWARRAGLGRQQLPRVYYSTAGIYLFKTSNIKGGDFYGNKFVPYAIDDEQYALDVNDLEDLEKARDSIMMFDTPEDRIKDIEAYQKLCEEYKNQSSTVHFGSLS